LRIIAGSAKGLRLKAPKGLATRPTSDRVREALFSILSPALPGARFLDLFAGSGAVGLEALSRGADRAVFVEKSRQAQAVISDNLKRTSLQERAEIIPVPAEKAIKLLAGRREQFEIVFLDPPYGQNFVPKTIELLLEADLLSRGGCVVAETMKGEDLPPKIKMLLHTRKAEYGQTALHFYFPEE
jgi:16S rRNA (guanine966-N2)-methyltransferase